MMKEQLIKAMQKLFNVQKAFFTIAHFNYLI